VLLARLQRHAQRGAAGGVARDADDAAWNGALVLLASREEGGVGSSVAERDPEALGRSDGDVGPELARRAQQAQREQVGGDDQQRARGVRAAGS
jgi:hypothetical protein